jgi:hypothetical protein
LRKTSSGKVEYYDDEGKTLKNFFLKTPIKFSRITSRFTMQRFIPCDAGGKHTKELIMPAGTLLPQQRQVLLKTGYTAGNGNYKSKT